MLYELRTYDFAPGKAVAYADLFRREGLPLITRYLPLVGYFVTEIGALNRLHHLWVYASLADRAEKRARFMQDKDWTEGFLPRGLALVQRQESRLLSLISGSDELSRAVSAAGHAHEAEPAEAPLFGAGWFALGKASEAEGAGHIAHWRVLAGADAGSALALRRLDPSRSLDAPALDLCRPLRFSPLA